MTNVGTTLCYLPLSPLTQSYTIPYSKTKLKIRIYVGRFLEPANNKAAEVLNSRGTQSSTVISARSTLINIIYLTRMFPVDCCASMLLSADGVPRRIDTVVNYVYENTLVANNLARSNMCLRANQKSTH